MVSLFRNDDHCGRSITRLPYVCRPRKRCIRPRSGRISVCGGPFFSRSAGLTPVVRQSTGKMYAKSGLDGSVVRCSFLRLLTFPVYRRSDIGRDMPRHELSEPRRSAVQRAIGLRHDNHLLGVRDCPVLFGDKCRLFT